MHKYIESCSCLLNILSIVGEVDITQIFLLAKSTKYLAHNVSFMNNVYNWTGDMHMVDVTSREIQY